MSQLNLLTHILLASPGNQNVKELKAMEEAELFKHFCAVWSDFAHNIHTSLETLYCPASSPI